MTQDNTDARAYNADFALISKLKPFPLLPETFRNIWCISTIQTRKPICKVLLEINNVQRAHMHALPGGWGKIYYEMGKQLKTYL
jgi:hypothetical protein